MIAYWIFFIIFGFIALNENQNSKSREYYLNLGIPWYFWILVFTFFIGFRYNIGTDWFPYHRLFEKINSITFKELFDNISYTENISYSVLLWISGKLDFGIFGANLFMGFLFSFLLIIFCNHFSRPYLALLISIPYIIIVVGMGFGKQGVALAFLMVSFLFLFQNKKFYFILFILIGASFHKSLIIFLPFLALSFNYNKYSLITISILIFPILYIFFFQDYVYEMLNLYVYSNYQSKGAFIRLFINFIPSVFFIIFFKQFQCSKIEKNTWFIVSILNVILFVLYFRIDGNAALDRISIYLTPIQIVAYTYMPEILSKRMHMNKFIVFVIILIYSIILFVWINYSVNSVNWLPYNNILFNF
jgi:hypothetical protein